MTHRTILLTSLCLAIFLIAGCKKDGVPNKLEGKWATLSGNTKAEFRDGELETEERIFDAKYQTDKDGIIIEVNNGMGARKLRIKFLDDNTIYFNNMEYCRKNN